MQIRNAADAIVGTGLAVSMDGKVVTCRHVVDAAIYGTGMTLENAEMGVYFQFAAGGEKKERRAVVEKFFQQNDEDIVLLRLKDGDSPLAPEQLPKLGDASESAGHKFTSFGYRRLSNYQGLPARGEIIDFALAPDGATLLCDPVMLECQHIDSGMSGAAVLDVERNLVVGIVAETYESAGRAKDRDTAFAVDNRVLTFSPFDFKLEDEPYPLKTAPKPKFDRKQAEAAVFITQKYSWNNAPTLLPEWTGREDLLASLTADWNDPQKHVAGLIGFGGEGKSSLARKWVDNIIASRSLAKQSPIDGQNPFKGEITSLAMTSLDGVFWWGFYENRSVDEFIEAALKYLSGGRIDPKAVPSSSLRAQIIGAMLGAGRYLFVLDGFEVMQHQDGDQYGLVTSNDLRDLLAYFARPDNPSFCLITSRAPLLDLMEYTTYSHHDVDRLTESDGVALLKKLGVLPSPGGRGAGGEGRGDAELARIVSDWDGHALTISLIGSYLTEKHGGDLAHLADLPAPIADEPRYERVHRVLRRYDEHLTQAEREFLKLFSAFRTPVHENAFEKVFAPLLGLPTVGATHPNPKDTPSGKSSPRKADSSGTGGSPLPRLANRLFGKKTPDDRERANAGGNPLPAGLTDGRERATRLSPDGTNSGGNPSPDGLTDGSDGYPTGMISPLQTMVNRLVLYRILKHDPASQTYTAHPLVRNHYLAILTHGTTEQPDNGKTVHNQIKEYYLGIAGDTLTYPTLDDLKPLIEVVHHACEAGVYDAAMDIYYERISQKNRFVILHQLGAYDTALSVLSEFFIANDLSGEPQVTKPEDKRLILATIGLCLTNLGRLREAVPFFERYVKGNIESQDWHNASIGYQNLAELHASLGALEASAESARQALDLARRAENKQDEQWSLEWNAWDAHLLGNIESANEMYKQLETIQQERDSSKKYLYSLDGIHHADHLRRTGQADYARRVTDANLQICEQQHWPDDTSRCHRVLGDIYADSGNHTSARAHYETALKIARGISARYVLIEALLARGRWAARYIVIVGAGSPRPISGANGTGQGDPAPTIDDAFGDLNEALHYAIEGGYRLYEADIRVALGWAWLASEQLSVGSEPLKIQNRKSAIAEAERALSMSREMGYHWGRLDAGELLQVISDKG